MVTEKDIKEFFSNPNNVVRMNPDDVRQIFNIIIEQQGDILTPYEFKTLETELKVKVISKKRKIITYHWVEMRKIEVPFDCPDNDISAMTEWINEYVDKDFWGGEGTGYCPDVAKEFEVYMSKSDTRDWEIVDVDEVK